MTDGDEKSSCYLVNNTRSRGFCFVDCKTFSFTNAWASASIVGAKIMNFLP